MEQFRRECDPPDLLRLLLLVVKCASTPKATNGTPGIPFVPNGAQRRIELVAARVVRPAVLAIGNTIAIAVAVTISIIPTITGIATVTVIATITGITTISARNLVSNASG